VGQQVALRQGLLAWTSHYHIIRDEHRELHGGRSWGSRVVGDGVQEQLACSGASHAV
jgi:hypothetical protein